MDKMKLDQMIGDTLKNAAEGISAPENMKVSVKVRMNENKGKFIKWSGLKKGMVATVAALAVVVTGALASGQIAGIIGHSSSNEKLSYEDTQASLKEIAPESNIPEAFSAGYQFENARHIYGGAQDEGGNIVQDIEELSATYSNGSAEIMLNIVGKGKEVFDASNAQQTKEINGITVQYIKSEFMFVPTDYELSTEEQAQVDAGEITVSYGADKVEYKTYEQACWLKDNAMYTLFGMEKDLDLGADFLFAMAEEVIAA